MYLNIHKKGLMELLDEMWVEILGRSREFTTIRLVCKFWEKTVHRRFVENPRDITYEEYTYSFHKDPWIILHLRSVMCGLSVTKEDVESTPVFMRLRKSISIYGITSSYWECLYPRTIIHDEKVGLMKQTRSISLAEVTAEPETDHTPPREKVGPIVVVRISNRYRSRFITPEKAHNSNYRSNTSMRARNRRIYM